MFDFLKDIGLASHGVDIEAVYAGRAEERGNNKSNKFIFSIKLKVIICILSALYIAVAIYTILNRGGFSFDSAVDVLLIAVALSVIVCLWSFGKKGEVISLCGIAGLFIGIYMRTML